MKVLIILLMMSSSAFAQLHGGDIGLTVVNGKITTNESVYGAELGEIIPNEVDEPGFDSEAGTFPAGSSIGFSILDSLRKWDGTDFDTIPMETMSLSFGSSLGPISTPATPLIVEGFDLNVSADGAWHRHFDFILSGPASTGIYLLQMQLDNSDSGIVTSDPFYIVFNQNDTELNHDSAMAYVGSSIPEPSTFVLLAIGLLTPWRKR